jgi:hypothetical protein
MLPALRTRYGNTPRFLRVTYTWRCSPAEAQSHLALFVGLPRVHASGAEDVRGAHYLNRVRDKTARHPLYEGSVFTWQLCNGIPLTTKQ